MITDWLAALTDQERDTLGRRHAAASIAGGAVVRTPGGEEVPIPPLLTPLAMAGARLATMESDAHALLSALARLTRWLMADGQRADRERLFRAFAPLETRALASGWELAEQLVTARVDFVLDESGRHRALEVNATIPAMQGYSDAVAASFLRTIGRARGIGEPNIDALIDENGRNSDDLLASLLAHYRKAGGSVATPSITIVARVGDAQIGELEHYARRWRALGHATTIAHPEEARLDGNTLLFDGKPSDLVYRHVFARRLDPEGAFARACLEPRAHFIWNPIASHLEVKGLLGYLSRAADEAELAATIGLDDAERAAIARALPWTRLLERRESRGPRNESIADLAATVSENPDGFVIKRSWDYGGRSVFLGGDFDERAAARAGQVMERERPLGWRELVAAAVDDARDAWVVQELVRFRPERHLVAGPSGATWKDLYVDCSIYTNLGVTPRPQGGASRAAPGKIVNILGGGGLAPLIRTEVLAKL
jgi:hypothetical protein